jgi:hypothetical protein
MCPVVKKDIPFENKKSAPEIEARVTSYDGALLISRGA